MTDKKPQLRANVPQATEDWFRNKAAREGVTIQSLVAPVLNAVARGEIQGGFTCVPEPHGNARK